MEKSFSLQDEANLAKYVPTSELVSAIQDCQVTSEHFKELFPAIAAHYQDKAAIYIAELRQRESRKQKGA